MVLIFDLRNRLSNSLSWHSTSNVITLIDDDTLLLVFGDHGMTDYGDHGGDSSLELGTLLFAYSQMDLFDRVRPGEI
jgi:hypothetical protein